MITKLFYFGVQTLGGWGVGQEKFGQNPYFIFFFNDDLPYFQFLHSMCQAVLGLNEAAALIVFFIFPTVAF